MKFVIIAVAAALSLRPLGDGSLPARKGALAEPEAAPVDPRAAVPQPASSLSADLAWSDAKVEAAATDVLTVDRAEAAESLAKEAVTPHALPLEAAAAAETAVKQAPTAAPEFDYEEGEPVVDPDSKDGYKESIKDQVADHYAGTNPEDMKDPDECTDKMIDVCKDLWENRLIECESNKEKWAGMCTAPRYSDPATGRVHNCMKGQCSPLYQEVYDQKLHIEAQCHQFEGEAVQHISCQMCESKYPEHVLDCMSCGEGCMNRHCDDPESHDCLKNRDMKSCTNACVQESLTEVCSHYEGALEVSCHMCEQYYPRNAMECMTCSTECSDEHCGDAEDKNACLFSKEVGTCHGGCMKKFKGSKEAEDGKLCDTFEDVIEQASCQVCEKKSPKHVMECMGCETDCIESHCKESDVEGCAEGEEVVQCRKDCMDEHTHAVCKHFEANPLAAEGCAVCANKYSARVLDCMECGQTCLKSECKGEDHQECLSSDKFGECQTPCMADGLESRINKLNEAQLMQEEVAQWAALAFNVEVP